MRSVRPHEIVEGLPFGELGLEVHVVLEARELIELDGVRAMRALDLSVQARRAGRDVDVQDPKLLDVPVELGLELVPAVRADLSNPEGKRSTT